MEGITILNQFVGEEILVSPWAQVCYLLTIFGFFGVFVFSILTIATIESEKRFLIPLILAALCFAAGVCTGLFGPYKNEIYYQVTISDEVNFNEFNEKYEIIEQNGLIYTIREREPK